jgi:hypothetical protein
MTEKKCADPERTAMERNVELLLSIVRNSGEVSSDMKVSAVTTNHPDNPTRIKLDLTDGSELELVYKPRTIMASALH